jgi:hypothetical protein
MKLRARQVRRIMQKHNVGGYWCGCYDRKIKPYSVKAYRMALPGCSICSIAKRELAELENAKGGMIG